MHPATSRNSGFTESADGLRYAEHMPLGQRVFVGVIGVAMFMIPVPFVVHAHWGLPWLQLLLVAVCVLAPSLLGVFLLGVAGCRPLCLQFGPGDPPLQYTSRWPLGPRRVPMALLHHVTLPALLQRASEDGPYYVVRLGLCGKRPLHLGSFDQREDAEHWRSRIAARLPH